MLPEETEVLGRMDLLSLCEATASGLALSHLQALGSLVRIGTTVFEATVAHLSS